MDKCRAGDGGLITADGDITSGISAFMHFLLHLFSAASTLFFIRPSGVLCRVISIARKQRTGVMELFFRKERRGLDRETIK